MQFCTLKMWVCKQEAFQWHDLCPRLSQSPHVSSVVVESEKNVNHHHTFAVPVSISCYHGMASIKACVCTKPISLCVCVCVHHKDKKPFRKSKSQQMQTFIADTEFLTFDLCSSVEHSKNLQDQLKHLLKWPIETKAAFLFQWCKCYTESIYEISSWLLITSMLCKYICSICMNVHIYQYIFMSCCLFWLICGVNFAFNPILYIMQSNLKVNV